jgi:hypothetical protein
MIRRISLLKLDLTAYSHGALVSIKIQDAFVNPSSEQPVQIQLKMFIKDSNNSTIAYYDHSRSSQSIIYEADPLEVQQFQVIPLDQVTGENGRY